MVAVSDETLAALLDGTLPPDERERVLRELASSPEAYGRLLEAQAVLASLAMNAAPDVASPSASRTRRVRRVRWMVAGGLAAAVLLTIVRTPPELAPIAALHEDGPLGAAAPGLRAEALGPGWDEPGWSQVRTPSGVLSADARAFRLGARSAALETAAAEGDTSVLRRASQQVAALLRAGDAGGPIALQVEAYGAGASRDVSARVPLLEQVRAASGSAAHFDLGTCVEGARFATRAQNGPFFSAQGATAGSCRALTARMGPQEGAWGPTISIVGELFAVATLDPVDFTRNARLVAAAYGSAPR